MFKRLWKHQSHNLNVKKVDDLGLTSLRTHQTYIAKWIALKVNLFGLEMRGTCHALRDEPR